MTSENLSSEAEARAHAEVDGMFAPDDDCGGWTWDPPCGACRRCAHMQVSYTFEQARKADGEPVPVSSTGEEADRG